MKATARPRFSEKLGQRFSTLGVIIAGCTASAVCHAQSVTPTAGFADATPEQQRLLSTPSSAEVAPAPAPLATPAPPAPAAAAPVAPVSPAVNAPAPAPASGRSYTYTSYTPPAQTTQYTPPSSGYRYTAPAYGYGPSSAPSGGGYGYGGGDDVRRGNVTEDRGGADGEKKKGEKEEHFRIGVLGGVGFPRPLAIEGMIKVEKLLGVGLEYSVLPGGITIESVNTSFYAVAATARLFPFKNAFFIGFRAGRQHVGGEGTVTVAPYGSFTETVTVDSTFINPRIGFLWTFNPGFSIGIDAGVQIPLSSTVNSSVAMGTSVDQDVRDVAERVGNSTLPTIDLLKIGFLL